MDRTKMNKVIDDCRNMLENVYRAGYEQGRMDCQKEQTPKNASDDCNFCIDCVYLSVISSGQNNSGHHSFSPFYPVCLLSGQDIDVYGSCDKFKKTNYDRSEAYWNLVKAGVIDD